MYNVHIPTKVAKIAETGMYPQQFWQPPGCFRQIPLVEKISLYWHYEAASLHVSDVSVF